jgi:hypothetical protein
VDQAATSIRFCGEGSIRDDPFFQTAIIKPATVLAAVNDKPFGRPPQEGAVIDRRCARWPDKPAVGAEECLRRGRTKE